MTITINEHAHGDDHHGHNEPRWLVVTGTVNEGFSHYGPFATSAAADRWAHSQPFSPHYVLAPLLEAFHAE